MFAYFMKSGIDDIIPHYTMLPRSSREYYRTYGSSSSRQTFIPSVNVQEHSDDEHDIPIDIEHHREEDVSDSAALADFLSSFYASSQPNRQNSDDVDDQINPEWAQLEEDGKTPLFAGGKTTRYDNQMYIMIILLSSVYD
jgi:hypothetical protein